MVRSNTLALSLLAATEFSCSPPDGEPTQPTEPAEPEAHDPAPGVASTPAEPSRTEKLRARYEAGRGGRLFRDGIYFVDLRRAGLDGWRRGSAEAGGESEPQFLVLHEIWHAPDESAPDADPESESATDTASDPDAEHRIEIVVWRCRHVTVDEGAVNSKHSLTFENTGERVDNSDVKGLCDGNRKNWMATARELEADATVPVPKRKLGEAMFFAAARAANPRATCASARSGSRGSMGNAARPTSPRSRTARRSWARSSARTR